MPTLKTDQIAPSDEQNAMASKQMHDFFEGTRTTCMALVAAFIIILLFIVGPFRPSGGMSMFAVRCIASLILVYGISVNVGAMGNIYNIKGVFTLNTMSDVRRNFYTSAAFTALMAFLAAFILYKHF